MRPRWLGSLLVMAALPFVGMAGVATGVEASGATDPGARAKLSATTDKVFVTSPATTTYTMLVTLYGWGDESPPGCRTAYSGCAGGKGTYLDPTTFATDKAELPVGTLVYYVPLRRYFVMGSGCAACGKDWTGHGPDGGPRYRRIELWAGGGKGDSEAKLAACEDHWASRRQVRVVVSPPATESVANHGAGGPVFSDGTGECWHG